MSIERAEDSHQRALDCSEVGSGIQLHEAAHPGGGGGLRGGTKRGHQLRRELRGAVARDGIKVGRATGSNHIKCLTHNG